MKQILVVDDQPEVREILDYYLTFKGFEIIQADNGQSALEQFHLHQPDAAIVDVKMPIMNGLQFSKQILSEYVKFPIIIITGYIKEYSKEDFFNLGVKAVMTKPLDLNELNLKLQEILA